MPKILNGVSRLSLITAAARAIETENPDGLFKDPFAANLAGEDTIAKARPNVQKFEDRGTPIAIVRTRYYDDFLQSKADLIRQVVILGAGMDTRAFRLPWPSDTHLFEIDTPDVIEYKESILEDTPSLCHRHLIAVDLKEMSADSLVAQGFQADIPTIWLMEGFIYYLDEPDVHRLLKTITDLSTPGSFFGADFINSFFIGRDTGEFSQYWKYGCDEPESLLSTYNWSASVVQASDEDANYGRFTYRLPARDVKDAPHYFFAQAILNPL
ncbi:SAM-dependent methyltransferase [Acaryochloris marina NIES-2412]|uniref:SAM-dependent methyltransferase n=1 Tax=Acaryochloris marina TaxID=155978 RepID=UPI0040597856